MAVWQIKRKKTDENIQKFLTALRNWHHIDSACVLAWIARSSVYWRMKEDEDFCTQVEEAKEFWLSVVEWKMTAKVNEWYRPGIEKELKSKRREIYWDKQEIEHSWEVKSIVVKLPDIS